MIGKMIAQDDKEEPLESEKLVSEILEIRNMMETIKKKALEVRSSRDPLPDEGVERIEQLLQTLRLEMVKRSILLANKHGVRFKPSVVPAMLNGGGGMGKLKESSFIDFSKLEEDLDRACRVARETLNNLSRLV